MNKTITFFVSSFFVLTNQGFCQSTAIDWDFLAKVEWGEKYYEEYDEVVWYPNFSDDVKEMNGKPVEIKGYIIPIDVETGFYILSAFPFASCFFCGNAGPESVVELQFKEELKGTYKTDQIATFQGRLKLNWDDLEHCNYILEEVIEK